MNDRQKTGPDWDAFNAAYVPLIDRPITNREIAWRCFQAGRAALAVQPGAVGEDALIEVISERDERDLVIDAILDLVLGNDRPEWSSIYGFHDAVNDVDEHMASLAAAPTEAKQDAVIQVPPVKLSGAFTYCGQPARYLATLKRASDPHRNAIVWTTKGGDEYISMVSDFDRDIEVLDVTPLAAAPAEAKPAQDAVPDGYTKRVIEALQEDGDPVSVDAAEEMQRLLDLTRPAQDAVDDLQGAANWLSTAIDRCDVGDIQQRLSIGYNRARRLLDAAISAKKGGDLA